MVVAPDTLVDKVVAIVRRECFPFHITPSSSSCMDFKVPPLLSPRCPCWHWEPKGCVLSGGLCQQNVLDKVSIWFGRRNSILLAYE
jgi:hypothetical protein